MRSATAHKLYEKDLFERMLQYLQHPNVLLEEWNPEWAHAILRAHPGSGHG